DRRLSIEATRRKLVRMRPRVRLRNPILATVAALAGPVVATAIGTSLPHPGAASAASLYMLVVVAAAVFGGPWSGVVAAFLSFLGLNYFFTRPFHTLKVRHGEDLVALGVFLVVATVVAALVARLREERQ